MFLACNPYRWLFVSILFSGLLSYLFKSGVIAYGPIILSSILVIIHVFITDEKVWDKYLVTAILWLPYVGWAGIVYVYNPLNGSYLSPYLLTILTLPLLTLSFSRLLLGQNKVSNYKFIYNALFFYVLFQLLICAGQISKISFGVGFPVNELYAGFGMITGTFFNSNDLAAVVLAILFFVLGLEKLYFKDDRYVFWLVAFVLLLIAGSRSALVLAVLLFALSKARSVEKTLLYAGITFVVLSILMFLIENVENDIIGRLITRFDSFVNVLNYGLSSDNSVAARLGSYLHFISKIPDLGLGSMEINNYFRYQGGADSRWSDLLLQNPHSLVVELGYWLGWPGLVFFFLPLFFMLKYSKRRFSLLVVFVLVSTIPSSILGNIMFFMLLVLCFFDYQPVKSK